MLHVVAVHPVPGRRLDLAADQLVLQKGSDQLFPIPGGKLGCPTHGAGTTNVARQQVGASIHSTHISAVLINTEHSRNTSVVLDALLEYSVDLNHGIADLIDLIALPRNRHQNLSPPAAISPCGDVQPDMPLVIEHRPAPATSPLRQGVRHDGPDRHIPITSRRLVRCLVRCSSHSLASASTCWRSQADQMTVKAKAFGRKPSLRKRSGWRESNPHHQLGRLRFYH